jgi:hypothetical protein
VCNSLGHFFMPEQNASQLPFALVGVPDHFYMFQKLASVFTVKIIGIYSGDESKEIKQLKNKYTDSYIFWTTIITIFGNTAHFVLLMRKQQKYFPMPIYF